eukprot:gnl/MRDRNA2_/MRDRNA2_77015_c0_seq1.p1 gnl/MRDRNA2_/MRDRNA2_77015_c0~~gnl/MRDRNA2_/MRDRNA2_77015_c0_seq1.p1  ORF type:complete len:115 (-),score=8.23 gnl/MRDRNA2_/MRDRNA2_77015_c0_seq1:17-361(-)
MGDRIGEIVRSLYRFSLCVHIFAVCRNFCFFFWIMSTLPKVSHTETDQLEMNASYEFFQVQLVFVKTSFNAQAFANCYEDVSWESVEFLYDNLTDCHSAKSIMDGQWCGFVRIG